MPKTILDKHIGHKNNKLKIPIMALFYKDTQLNKNQIAHKYSYYWRTIRSRQAIWLFLGIGFISIGLLISALGTINHNFLVGVPLIYLGITLFILVYISKKLQQHTNANKAKEEQERLESPIDDSLLANLIILLAVRNSSSHNGKAPSRIKVAKNFSRKEFERIKTTYTKDLKQKLDQALKPNKSSNYTAIELQKVVIEPYDFFSKSKTVLSSDYFMNDADKYEVFIMQVTNESQCNQLLNIITKLHNGSKKLIVIINNQQQFNQMINNKLSSYYFRDDKQKLTDRLEKMFLEDIFESSDEANPIPTK